MAGADDTFDLAAARAYFLDVQSRIVAGLEAADGQTFRRDEWKRESGGGGLSCLIEEGNVFERAGVLFSHVTGNHLPPSASAVSYTHLTLPTNREV